MKLTSTASATSATATIATIEPAQGDDEGEPIGAIVGGTVGGVAALVILAGVVWWFFRRKRARLSAVSPTQDEVKMMAVPLSPRELDGDATSRSEPKELQGQHGTSELPA